MICHSIVLDCMDEMSEAECAKIVEKGKCEKKGQKCMKSCSMCDGGEETTTAVGGIITFCIFM